MPCDSREFLQLSGLRLSSFPGCSHWRRRTSNKYLLNLCAVALALSVPTVALPGKDSAKLELTTTAFRPGGAIPVQFTCSGENISPTLSWSQPPAGTQSFALIVDDPDAPAGTWVHWVVYDLPASARQLPEHVAPGEKISGRGEQGINDFSKRDYGGPCPPPGKPHRYFFRLYALDVFLNLHSPARRQEVDSAMKGHILAQAELMGTFRR